MPFEFWWILVIFPLYSLWNAIAGVWQVLLQTPSEDERKMVIEGAFIKVFVSTAAVAGMWAVPWPYKALCLVPSLFPATLTFMGNVLHVMFSFKYRHRL